MLQSGTGSHRPVLVIPKNAKTDLKREKLTGFANWPVWSGITESMPIEKDVWDLVSTEPRPARENPSLWSKKVKEDRMTVGTA